MHEISKWKHSPHGNFLCISLYIIVIICNYFRAPSAGDSKSKISEDLTHPLRIVL